MAWHVYGAMHGRDARKGFPIIYGPLPIKRWVPSPTDRKHRVKRGAKDSATGRASVKEYTAERAEPYARWLAQRDGVAVPDGCKGAPVWSSVGVAGKLRPEPRVRAVEFRALRAAWSSETVGPVLVTIAIPHWDWVPVMTEGEEQIKVAA
jgi:hypothetical protein